MSFVSSKKSIFLTLNFSSFDGDIFKTEPSSKFPHSYVWALGSYRNSPFVTGESLTSINGLKTEILNYGLRHWEQTSDYPFSNGDRYVSKDFMESNENLHDRG